MEHVDNPQMVSHSTKEPVVNVVEVESGKGEVESSVDTKKEKTERKKSYADILIKGVSLYQ